MTFVHRSWRLGLVATLALFAVVAVAPVLGATIGVSIVDNTFEPAEIVIAEGDTVTWTVTAASGAPHTVTSAAADGAAQGAAFDSQADDPDLTKVKDVGGTFSFTFDEAGTFAYLCTVHPIEMTGTVEVLAAGETPGEVHAPVPPERKLAGAAILGLTLIVLFAAAWFWRRMNPA
ncbi:MAG TPA: plastocyanin/azurin family copper-binding protein [Candidatus Limnocylindria bacterium]|nr:plastocyanin/azurin family copper-binding protein [Candidatus Limnocylindria bacterium]